MLRYFKLQDSCSGCSFFLEDGLLASSWLGSKPCILFSIKRPFGRGPTTGSLGDLQSPWLLITCKSRGDPPSDQSLKRKSAAKTSRT